MTPNHPPVPGVRTEGPNHFQNYPVLQMAYSDELGTVVAGALDSIGGQRFRIEFFASAVADPSGYGEGQTYLGFADVMTDRAGHAAIPPTLLSALPAGQAVITATATYLLLNDTSEFSLAITATITPPSLGALFTTGFSSAQPGASASPSGFFAAATSAIWGLPDASSAFSVSGLIGGALARRWSDTGVKSETLTPTFGTDVSRAFYKRLVEDFGYLYVGLEHLETTFDGEELSRQHLIVVGEWFLGLPNDTGRVGDGAKP